MVTALLAVKVACERKASAAWERGGRDEPRRRPACAPHLLGITERAESDTAARDEGERTCYHIATSTEHLTISSANP